MTLRYVPFLFIVVAAVACRGRVAERVGRSQGMPTKASGVVETDGGRATEPVPTGEVDTAGSDAATRDDAAPEDLVRSEDLLKPDAAAAGGASGPRDTVEAYADKNLALDGEPLVALGAPVSYCGLDDQGRVRCPEEGYDFGEPVVATAWIRDAAAFCVLLESGTLICSEAILDPPVLTDALQLSASSWRVCAVSRGGAVVCGEDLRLEGETYVQVSMGDFESCALTEDGEVVCFVITEDGQNGNLAGRTAGEVRVTRHVSVAV